MAGTTYLNAFEMLAQVRYGINEYSSAYMAATDTTGTFANSEIMRALNTAQDYLWSVVFTQFPSTFIKTKDIAASSSVLTLPADFFRVKLLEDSNDVPILPIDAINKSIGMSGSGYYRYYRKANTLIIDTSDNSDTYTLWYYWRCREIDQGTTSAGGALSATLATTAKKIVDYYNDMKIENITDDAPDTISDYTAARVATVGTTWASSKVYGIVSELPDIFHPLIIEKAILQIKQSPKHPENPSAADLKMFYDNLGTALRIYGGFMDSDVSMDDIINDFESRAWFY